MALKFHGKKFIWIDETGLDLEDRAKKAYLKKGDDKPLYIPSKIEHFSIVMAVTEEHGILGYTIFKGSVKGLDFA